MPKDQTTLIHDPQERQKRIELKKQRLLDWLVDFTWTTPSIAGEVMGIYSRGSINKTISMYENLGLIKTSYLELVHTRKMRIIGITPNGLLWCDSRDDAYSKQTFDISKVALSTANHRLDVQRCRLKIQSLQNLSLIHI